MDRKEAACDFLQLVASGRVAEAYDRYVAAEFRHHNPFFAGDAQSLKAAMEENVVKFPDKDLEVQHAVQEGDLVVVHSRLVLGPGQPLMALVHIFRFSGDKVVELWDIGQTAPADSPNQYGMF